MSSFDFANEVIAWQQQHGRHLLPWQINSTAYKVYLSEVMLQQTQVSTVIPYFNRFMKTFPTLEALARAPLDQVLQLWAGLGYYARGRNLHKSAQIMVKKHHGQVPSEYDELIELPCIGRSTAGAILSTVYHRPYPILDGNVKRVFCRFFALEGWPDSPAMLKQLWALANQLLPKEHLGTYHQGLMDLGATRCTRRQPLCTQCPLNSHCQALQNNLTAILPTPKKAIPKIEQIYYVVVIQNTQGQFLMQQRPSRGIWGSLWTPPLFENMPERQGNDHYLPIKTMTHLLTHRKLILKIFQYQGPQTFEGQWFYPHDFKQLGMPKPIDRFFHELLKTA